MVGDQTSRSEGTEVPDLKNGATEKTEETKKKMFSKLLVFSVVFVDSVAPFLRSGTSVPLPNS
jgi:hypothetical protein